MASALPLIDVAPLLSGDTEGAARAADQIGRACRETGFFLVTGHAVSAGALDRLKRASIAFFHLPEAEKEKIAMPRGGRAWRGWFPLHGELTSGRPDNKEGLYFGEELGPDDPRVQAGLPLHGANLFPEAVPELRTAVLDFMAGAEQTAHAVVRGVALALGLEPDYFRAHYTGRPTQLFRIFRYPSQAAQADSWGVGEHTDYGLLTLLAQDDIGGLEVKSLSGWIPAPPMPGALVCNIGDMLDRLTGGEFRSTPHRVRNASGRERYSFPYFFDPAFDAEIVPLPARPDSDFGRDDSTTRWDGANLHALSGTYGDYLLAKVGKVFPDLARQVR